LSNLGEGNLIIFNGIKKKKKIEEGGGVGNASDGSIEREYLARNIQTLLNRMVNLADTLQSQGRCKERQQAC
jgi:hypothetical protein